MSAPALCTMEEARLHLRADDGDSDQWFAIFIPIVSELILSWLGAGEEWRLYESQRDDTGAIVRDENGNPKPAEDSAGEKIISPIVRGAAIVELADIYTNREGESRHFMESGGLAGGAWGYTLCAGATAMLSGLRKHMVA